MNNELERQIPSAVHSIMIHPNENVMKRQSAPSPAIGQKRAQPQPGAMIRLIDKLTSCFFEKRTYHFVIL
jgi:hypothetical protein